jgi:hypothetical protein
MKADVHSQAGSKDFWSWLNWLAMPPVPAFILALSLFKLALISNHEIVAALRPHDDYWHIQAAAQWVWRRPFSEWTLMHQPVYALYVAASGATGLPLRMSIELIYLLSAALLAVSLGQLGLRRALQVVVFALLAFHPFIYEGFDFALPETLYTCLMLVFVGMFVRIIAPKSRRDLNLSAALFACTAAMLWHLRKESVLIGGLFALLAVGVAFALIRKAVTRQEALGLAGRLVAGPAVAVIILGMAISAANGLRYGLWSTNELSAPNYVRAFSSLLAIRPHHSIRFVSVTKDVRERAYAVSPAFRELQPILDGEREHWTAVVTRTLGIPGGEIGTGWFYWALIDSVSAAGHFKTPADAESFYARVADEIEAALRDGRLPSRQAFLPYVDPDISAWLPHLPDSVMRLAKLLLPLEPPAYPERPVTAPAEVVETYDRVANRRASAIRLPTFAAQGWALSSSARPLEIEIVAGDGQRVPSRFEALPRIEVKPLIDQSGRSGPAALGYKISWAADARTLGSLRFKIVMEDNTFALSDPIASVPLLQVIRLPSVDPNFPVFFAVDRLDNPSRRSLMLADIIIFLTQVYPVLLGVFAALGLTHLIYLAFSRGLVLRLQAVTLLFVLATVSSRLLLFAVLDASAWSAEQTRYLLPIAVLLPVIPAIALTLGWRHRELMAAPPEAHNPDSTGR